MSGRANTRNKKVKVWGRIRPTANFAHNNLELLPDNKSINLHLKRDPKKGIINNQIVDWSFKLDGIFHNATQELVYSTIASDVITSALNGYNGTIMCYGQTGAGKTFTITGATENYRHRGIIPRSLSQLYREIEERPEFSITVRISYLEIYNEQMFDLLSSLPESESQASGEPMAVTENQDGTYVKGLSCHLAQNEEEALNLLFEGETNRAIATHVLNRMSSRSHCIFTIYLEARSRVHSNAKYTVSKINLVDLAGSERIGKTKSEGKMQTEALYINKSLSFLEQVVIALADKHREHIPFRQSKLTHYLKDSIGGNCNTVLVANMWGERSQLEETVSTLRFATRMMCVSSEPAVNEVFDPSACKFCIESYPQMLLVKKLQREIGHLKSELAMHDTLTNRTHVSYDPLSEQQRYEIRQQCRKYLEGALDEIEIVNLRQIHGTFEAFREIYSHMEHDVEERLKNKFSVSAKPDTAPIAGIQQLGMLVTDDVSLVGESDGTGFGVGTAPKLARAEPSAVVTLKKKEKERERKKTAQRGPSPVGKLSASPVHSAKGEREIKSPHVHTPVEPEGDGSLSPVSSVGLISKEKTTRPSTPPSRTVAFEEFKQEKGSEINRILIENKEILANKKKTYSDIAKKINNVKVEIDQTRQILDRLKNEREADGPMLNEDGDIVISEQEFLEIQKLKDLKSSYTADYEELKHLKSQVQYCQKLVDQCRQRLLQEFDKWYAESFLNQLDEQTSLQAGHGVRMGVILPINPNVVLEDEQEKFDRLQKELLMNSPDSAAFYNAKMRTQRRKTYETAISQSQPSYHTRRKPGTPTIVVRNKPPNMLQVQY